MIIEIDIYSQKCNRRKLDDFCGTWKVPKTESASTNAPAALEASVRVALEPSIFLPPFVTPGMHLNIHAHNTSTKHTHKKTHSALNSHRSLTNTQTTNSYSNNEHTYFSILGKDLSIQVNDPYFIGASTVKLLGFNQVWVPTIILYYFLLHNTNIKLCSMSHIRIHLNTHTHTHTHTQPPPGRLK